MAVVAFVTDAFAIRKILDHLGLSTPEAQKPPPLREVLRVAAHGEGWGGARPRGVACIRASTRATYGFSGVRELRSRGSSAARTSAPP